MEFSKYEATANDFIMLDCMSAQPHLTTQSILDLCDRRTGVGADGVILLLPSVRADFAMRILNADGSEAEMCGNGIRALFLFALDKGATGADRITVETPAGVKTVWQDTISSEHGGFFTVDMGIPAWTRAAIPMSGEGEAIGVSVDLGEGSVFEATCVSMGNPHCVIFVDGVSEFPVPEVGPRVENHPLFPQRTNVEFVQVVDGEHLQVRVWERGVGETMACGTGACASVVAAKLNDKITGKGTVSLPGGELQIDWLEDGVRLSGPARHIFDGKTVE
jgi:diaminopimelate epimerase